jgi:hypothetical protein
MDFYAGKSPPAAQGWLIGLSGLGVCSKFLIETITKRNELYYKLLTFSIFKIAFRCFRGGGSFRGEISVGLYDS